jgi:hypothetical protein
MGWASGHIERRQRGETVSFRPRGGSMTGRIEPGRPCTVPQVSDIGALRVDDIVLCKVKGAEYLHPIKAIQGARFRIGNNRGYINGWIGPNAICQSVEKRASCAFFKSQPSMAALSGCFSTACYGRCIEVEP